MCTWTYTSTDTHEHTCAHTHTHPKGKIHFLIPLSSLKAREMGAPQHRTALAAVSMAALLPRDESLSQTHSGFSHCLPAPGSSPWMEAGSFSGHRVPNMKGQGGTQTEKAMCSLTEGLSGESEGRGLADQPVWEQYNWIRMKSLQTSQFRLCCVQTLPVPPCFRLHEDIEPPFAELTFPWLQHRIRGMKPWKKKWQSCISTLDYYFPIKQTPYTCCKGSEVNTALELRGKSRVSMRKLPGVVAPAILVLGGVTSTLSS